MQKFKTLAIVFLVEKVGPQKEKRKKEKEKITPTIVVTLLQTPSAQRRLDQKLLYSACGFGFGMAMCGLDFDYSRVEYFYLHSKQG